MTHHPAALLALALLLAAPAVASQSPPPGPDPGGDDPVAVDPDVLDPDVLDPDVLEPDVLDPDVLDTDMLDTDMVDPALVLDDPAALAPATLSRHRIVATVNGEAITSADVGHSTRAMRSSNPDAPPDELLYEARRMLAEEIILAAECERLGVALSDFEVERYWERRFGRKPDYAAMAEAFDSTVSRQKELARRAALSELYMLHLVGIRSDQGHKVPVDPVLARMVSITPKQLRDYFREERDSFKRPATVAITAWLCDDPAAAQEAREAVIAGGTPARAMVARQTIPLESLPDLFPPDLASWTAEAAVEEVSEVFPTEDGRFLVVHVTARQEAEPADFARVQQDLSQALQMDLLMKARQVMVVRLIRDSVYWPKDLFQPGAGRVASPGGRP